MYLIKLIRHVNIKGSEHMGLHSREMTATRGWLDKKCQYCGKHFLEGDKFHLIVPTIEYKKAFKRLASNYIIHSHELEELIRRHNGNENTILIALGNHATPRVKTEITREQMGQAQAFEAACREYGLYEKIATADEVKMKKHGSSVAVAYNIRTRQMRFSSRHKKDMFSGLFEREFEAKIFNKMHELLGDGLRDDYTAAGVLKQAVDETNKMFGGK